MDLDVIRSVTVKATTEGVDETADKLQKLADAQGNVATVSDKAGGSSLGLSNALERQQRSLDVNYRATQQLNSSQSLLGKAFDQGLLSTDRYSALMALTEERYNKLINAANPLSEAVKSVQYQMVALAGNLGPAGVLLAGLGSTGLAAAAGLGAVVEGIRYASSEADRLGNLSIQMRSVADTVGLTTTQLQVLDITGAEVGLTSDRVTQSMERFSVQLASLRQGTGPLFTELDKISPTLVRQLSATHDLQQGWDLLAQSYANADSKLQPLIARAAFGRGGSQSGLLLGATAEQGGLGNLQSGLAQTDLLTQAQIRHWAELQTQIDDTLTRASNRLASTFADAMLGAKQSAAGFFDYFTRAVKSLKEENFSGTWLREWSETMTDLRNKMDIGSLNPASLMAVGQRRLADMTFGPPTPSGSEGTPQTRAAQWNAYTAAMGAAATPTEVLHGKMLELDVVASTFDEHLGALARKQSDLNESFRVDSLNAMVAALGNAATPAEKLTDATARLHLELDRGKLTQEYYARSVTEARNASAAAVEQQRVALGIADMEALKLQGLIKLQDDRYRVVIKTDSEMRTAEFVFGEQLKNTAQQMEILRTRLPNLTTLSHDAGDLGKQLDNLTTTSLTNVGNALTDITTGTVDLSTGMKNLEQQFIKSLVNMAYQMAVIKPAADALKSSLSYFLPSLAPSTGAGIPTLNPGSAGAIYHSGGIVGSEPTAFRYMHPSYFDDAPHFARGGIAGDEVPIVAHRGEGVFTAGQMKALGGGSGKGSSNVQVNVYNMAAGTTARVEQSTDGNGVDIRDVIIATVNDAAAGGKLDPALRARMGVRPPPRAR